MVVICVTGSQHHKFKEANEVIEMYGLQGHVEPVDSDIIEAQEYQQKLQYLQLPSTVVNDITIVNSLETVALARRELLNSRFVGVDSEWSGAQSGGGASILQVIYLVKVTW
jgi:hypothetical protein